MTWKRLPKIRQSRYPYYFFRILFSFAKHTSVGLLFGKAWIRPLRYILSLSHTHFFAKWSTYGSFVIIYRSPPPPPNAPPPPPPMPPHTRTHTHAVHTCKREEKKKKKKRRSLLHVHECCKHPDIAILFLYFSLLCQLFLRVLGSCKLPEDFMKLPSCWMHFSSGNATKASWMLVANQRFARRGIWSCWGFMFETTLCLIFPLSYVRHWP